MGRNLSKEVGLTSFGIKARKVEFVLPPTLAFSRKAEIIRRRSNLMKIQQNLMKWIENPSGPGALSGSIAQMTSTISCSVNGFTSPTLSSRVTKGGMLDKKSAATISSEIPSSWNKYQKCKKVALFMCNFPLIASPSPLQFSEM